MSVRRIVLATANAGKVREIEMILAGLAGVEVVARPADIPDVAETADTMEGNARIKAHAIASATGLAALADDSGIEVDALCGGPGVYSARYAGENATDADNVSKLLFELQNVGDSDRTARFVCVALLVLPDGREFISRGSIEGVIATEIRGSGGFGFDPLFMPVEGDGRTFGEMTREEKTAMSHRGRAFAKMRAYIESEIE